MNISPLIFAHRFHALNLSHFDQVRSNAFLRNVGNQWAKKAEAILLDNYGKISTHRLMVCAAPIVNSVRGSEFH